MTALRLTALALILLSSCASVKPRADTSAITRVKATWSTPTSPHYTAAVRDVLQEIITRKPSQWGKGITLRDGSILRIDRSKGCWNPDILDEVRIEATYNATKAGVRPGIGISCLAIRHREADHNDKAFIHRRDQQLPCTAVIDCSQSTAVLRLIDPREITKLKGHPIAADFYTPVQKVLHPRNVARQAFGGLFHPERFMSSCQLYAQEPYRADKVSIIFVHGLASDPHIWQPMVTAINADPVLGPRVQCWCFVYPSGLPVANSSHRLRDELHKAEQLFDPDQNDVGMQHSVMTGHSMGGLLTRMQIVDSQSAFWDTWFRVPPEKLTLSKDSVAEFRSALIFNSDPSIKRAVFICTPHRGAQLADTWIGTLGNFLIRLPLSATRLATSIASLDPRMLNASRLKLKNFGSTSISNLSPQHPILKAMNTLPLRAPAHSIIAAMQKSKALPETSDGVVPYTSSHLDGVRSEKVVHGTHSCTQQEEVVQEMLRILREHVAQKK